MKEIKCVSRIHVCYSCQKKHVESVNSVVTFAVLFFFIHEHELVIVTNSPCSAAVKS